MDPTPPTKVFLRSKKMPVQAMQNPTLQRSNKLLVIFERTWKDFLNLKKFFIYVIMLVIVPAIYSKLSFIVPIESIPTSAGVIYIMSYLIGPIFFWTAGLGLALVTSINTAPLLAGEVETHRMATIASRPISRIGIFVSKFLGAYMVGIMLSFAGIFFAGLITVILLTGNIILFRGSIPVLLLLWTYSFLFLFLCTSLSFGISALASRSSVASIASLLAVFAMFAGMNLIRVFYSTTYISWQLYHLDLQYHLGNAVVALIMASGILPPISTWQQAINAFTGVFSAQVSGGINQGFSLNSLELINYYTPLCSILLVVLISAGILALGYFKFKRRDLV